MLDYVKNWNVKEISWHNTTSLFSSVKLQSNIKVMCNQFRTYICFVKYITSKLKEKWTIFFYHYQRRNLNFKIIIFNINVRFRKYIAQVLLHCSVISDSFTDKKTWNVAHKINIWWPISFFVFVLNIIYVLLV